MLWEKELRKIYKDLDKELSTLAPPCRSCGECCHFDEYGHKLYVSDIEVEHILKNVGCLKRPSIKVSARTWPTTSARYESTDPWDAGYSTARRTGKSRHPTSTKNTFAGLKTCTRQMD